MTTLEPGLSLGPLGVRGARRSLSPRSATALRVVLAVTVVVAAYHHSLATLLSFLSYDTPLAYIALVPLVVLVLAVLMSRPRPGEGRLPDRQVDWIIGIPLLATAAAMALFLPGRLSYHYWTNRLDLIGLPFFVAGLVAVLFGSRMLHRLRVPIVLLLLAWPYPYEHNVQRLLAVTTDVTVASVRAVLPLLHGVRAAGGSVFDLGAGSRQFSVNVAPTCAGANSSLGFLVVGGAALLVLRGRRLAKLAWLLSGMVLVMVLNLARLMTVFWAGDRYGERVAIDWLHPYIGLVLFSIGVGVMIWLLPRFGITTPAKEAAQAPARDAVTQDQVGASRSSVRVVTRTAVAVIVVLAAGLGVVNSRLTRYDPFLGVAGAASVRPVGAVPPSVTGWTGSKYDDIAWAKRYFGETSTWQRFSFTPVTAGAVAAGAHGARHQLWLDVVNSPQLSSFSRFGLEACYRFHDYRIVDSRRIDVGGPAPGQSVTYYSKLSRSYWSMVSWVTPVSAASRGGGAATGTADAGRRYERAVVMTSFGGSGGAMSLESAQRSEADLVTFAKAFVATRNRS